MLVLFQSEMTGFPSFDLDGDDVSFVLVWNGLTVFLPCDLDGCDSHSVESISRRFWSNSGPVRPGTRFPRLAPERRS